MVLVQKWTFFQFFFSGNIGQENLFCDILEQINSILGYQNKRFTPSKYCHFSKGVNPRFWSNNGHISSFLFQAITARKIIFTIFQNEKTPSQAINKRSSKGQKLDIFPKRLTHGFQSKNCNFSNFFFFWQYRPRKRLLRYSRTKKNAILAYKKQEV